MQPSGTVIKHVEDLNASRPGKPAYSYRHIQQGFRGGFFQYAQGETPCHEVGRGEGLPCPRLLPHAGEGLIKGGSARPRHLPETEASHPASARERWKLKVCCASQTPAGNGSLPSSVSSGEVGVEG